MIEEDIDVSVKVIVVGNGQVGKTSMITRFAKGIFTNEYKKTIGVDFLEKKMYLSSLGEEITFLLWDTAGQEEYDALTRTYYKGAGAVVFAFSTTDRASFDDIKKWHAKVVEECGNPAMVLVQNKVDLMDDARMDAGEVEQLAKELRLKLYRTCVKDDLNVTDVFTHLGKEFVNRGGESALGSSGVPSMEEMATKPIVERSANNPASASSAGAGGDAAPAASAPENGAALGGDAFKLGAKGPSVRRTGGKKRMFTGCNIL